MYTRPCTFGCHKVKLLKYMILYFNFPQPRVTFLKVCCVFYGTHYFNMLKEQWLLENSFS